MTNRFDINRSQRGIPAFSVLLIMAALAVIGVAMLPMLNVQYTPSPVERKIDVSFTWPDASARLIEQSVTSRIEGALSAITGSESVSSRSSKGSGRVTIRFRKGTEMAAARFEVASAIRNLYPKLPEEVSYPAISIATGGTRESDMLVYTIKADLPSRRIEEYVEAHMSTPLSQTEGVGKVSLSGVTPFEWVITFDPKAMEVNGISAADLAAAFRDYFRSDVIDLTTLPHADGTDRSIVLKLRNRASLNFGDIPIARRNGRIYHLRDFATARWCEAPPSTYFRINGLNTITLSIGCEASTNMLRVAENVKEEMQRLQAAFPPGISATLTYDASEYVSGELHKIYLRTLLCVAILMLFVYLVSRDFNYLLIIAVTLAVNILVAVVFYNLLNLDIHIYTLAGITVSLGIIIDSSIIMVDHYSYYRNRRVFVSILGALLTTIGALGIVWLLPEKQQANLTDFSLVIVINLVVSLIVALLFIPALLDKFPLKRSMTVSSVKRRRLTVRVSRAYARFIGWGRRHRWLFIVALIWGFGIPTFLLPEKIEPEKGETPGRGTELYNKIMEGRFMTEHRSFLDKFLGSSLHLFHTATSRYNNFREPEQKVTPL
jgi:multidrug efflux pump subunit AcrB